MKDAEFVEIAELGRIDPTPFVKPEHIRCRNCALFTLSQVMSKSGSVLKDRVGKCRWESIETWPVSIPEHTKRLSGNYMAASDGEGCPTFKLDIINCARGVLPSAMLARRKTL